MSTGNNTTTSVSSFENKLKVLKQHKKLITKHIDSLWERFVVHVRSRIAEEEFEDATLMLELSNQGKK